MAIPIVDTHLHVVSDDRKTHPLAPIGGVHVGLSKDPPLSVENLVVALDAADISNSVIVQASTAYGYDNSYAAESLSRFRNRLIGVCAVDPGARDCQEQIRYWVTDRGFSGLRLFATGPGSIETVGVYEQWAAVWESARELDIPICIWMSLDIADLVKKLLGSYPGVKVVLDHMARPVIRPSSMNEDLTPLLALTVYSNLYLKLTTTNLQDLTDQGCDTEEVLGQIIRGFGSDHVMWGSNFPAAKGTITDLYELAQSRLSFLPERDQMLIFSETAWIVYPALRTSRLID